MSTKSDLPAKKLILENIPFAKRMAAHFHRKRTNLGFDLEDIEGAAMLGLCDAASRFEPDRGMMFRTFAYFRIKGAMFDLLREGGIQRRQFNRMVKNQEAFDNARSQDATESKKEPERDCAERIPYAFARTLQELADLMRTIDAIGIQIYISQSGEAELSYADAIGPEDATVVRSVRRYLRRLIRRLPERQQAILEKRYFEEQTFDQISEQLGGISKSWISRMHTAALDSLKVMLEEDQKLCRTELQRAAAAGLRTAVVG